ncbi:MUB1/samB family protein [Pleurotus pulmonarius]
MPHPLHWPGHNIYYYPLGNTPPTCLTEYTSCDASQVNILLMGCGDPRNILFTLLHDFAARQRSLDFTCCDVEPAVLARNVILLTLLVQHPNECETTWDIFYHMFISKDAQKLLHKHCRELLDLSEDLASWGASRYGFIRFCDSQTIQELRRHWLLYATACSDSRTNQTLARTLRKGMADEYVKTRHAVHVNILRSTGIALPEALSTGEGQVDRFWTNGTTYTADTTISNAQLPNPTFCYSLAGSSFAVHYGTHPLAGFHLAPAYVPLEGNRRPKKDTKPTFEGLVKFARGEFGRWGGALRRFVSSNSISISLFCGDVGVFSASLQRYIENGDVGASIQGGIGGSPVLNEQLYPPYAKQRSSKLFDVIDTSNLVDHIGLLNVLSSAIPLLRRTSNAVLVTEALHPKGEDPSMAFLSQPELGGNATTMSLLLGISPLGTVSGLTTYSNRHEMMFLISNSSDPSQFHERTAWRRTAISSDPQSYTLGISVPHLATLLFHVYQNMFVGENHATILARMSLSPMRSDRVRYVRGSFAALLRVIQARFAISTWNSAVTLLLDKIVRDRDILMGMNYFQDLYCNLHFHGVYTPPEASPNYLSTQVDGLELFRGWSTRPSITSIVIQVPRQKLKPLEESEYLTPVLYCDTYGGHNNTSNAVFSSVKAAFGKLDIEGSGENKVLLVHKDPLGLQGTSDFIVWFRVPTALVLGVSPFLQKVCLTVRSEPATISLVPQLGLALHLFSTTIDDRDHVHIATGAVLYPGKPQDIPKPVFHVQIEERNKVPVVKSISRRVDIIPDAARSSLLAGAQVSTTQEDPTTTSLQFTSFSSRIYWPLVIDNAASKVRIARKSAWIEVELPTASLDIKHKSLALSNVSPLSRDRGQVAPWIFHRVNLATSPKIDLSRSHAAGYISVNSTLQMSQRERGIAIRRGTSGTTEDSDALVGMKHGIHCIITAACGVDAPSQACAFTLRAQDVGIYCFIFIAGVCLDLSAHTVVADAYVLSLTESLIANNDRMPYILARFTTFHKQLQINTFLPTEVSGWKCLLPAFAERCRDWEHTDQCDYIVRGRAPLGVAVNDDPLCSCGRGKSVDTFLSKFPEWRDLAPLVTRIAISPLFAVSYLDQILHPSDHDPGTTSSSQSPGDNVGIRCGKCGGPGQPSLLRCSKCKNIHYCSSSCQKSDWKLHKIVCK